MTIGFSSRSKRDLSRRIRRLRRAADDVRSSGSQAARRLSRGVSRHPVATLLVAGVLVGTALLGGARLARV